MALAAGTRLGPYEILAPLGAGGMGEVYRARDIRLDRTVAIKLLPAHLSASPELQRRLEREAKAISQLSHPPPDGSRVALVHRDNRIRIIQLQDGTETELSADGWMLGETVAWSADGTSLFIDGGPLQSTVLKTALLNVTLEEDVRVLRHRVNDWHVLPAASPDGRYLAFGVMTFSGNVMMLEEF